MAQPIDAAPGGPAGGLSSLQKRVLSALVLIPVVLGLAYLGGFYWAGLVAAFGGTMAWEWARICGRRRNPVDARPAARMAQSDAAPEVLVSVASALLCILVSIFPDILPITSVWHLLLGAVAVATAAAAPRHGWGAIWFGLGTLYVVVPCWAILWVRAGDDGLTTLIWILGIVIAADTGAYAAGRSIGGPKLAPRISPSKTWAGLGGAVISAGIVGLCTAVWLEKPDIWPLALVSAALAIAEQGGDLAESALKRHFGVKDSSHIIPGHGGVLDRVDGLLAVTVIVAGLSFLKGSSVLTWQ